MKKEAFESLWSYCTENDRICPKPQAWVGLYNKLNNTFVNGGDSNPLQPAVLAEWWHTDDAQKIERFRKHIEWARKQDQLDEIGVYLRSLVEDEWLHSGEI